MFPRVWQYSYSSVHWMAVFVAKHSNNFLEEIKTDKFKAKS